MISFRTTWLVFCHSKISLTSTWRQWATHSWQSIAKWCSFNTFHVFFITPEIFPCVKQITQLRSDTKYSGWCVGQLSTLSVLQEERYILQHHHVVNDTLNYSVWPSIKVMQANWSFISQLSTFDSTFIWALPSNLPLNPWALEAW